MLQPSSSRRTPLKKQQLKNQSNKTQVAVEQVEQLKAVLTAYCTLGLRVMPLWGVKPSSTPETKGGFECQCGNLKCGSPGKHPRLAANWKQLGTADLAKVMAWAEKYPTCNYAVLTGSNKYAYGTEECLTDAQRYLTVVDVDDLEAITQFTEPLPDTYSTETGKGRHYWFWHTRELPNSVCTFYDKVDIKGGSGYIVAPPSTHITGKKYTVTPGKENTPIAELPAWVEERLAYVAKVAKAPAKLHKATKIKAASTAASSAATPQKATLAPQKTFVFNPLVATAGGMNAYVLREWIAQGNLIPNGARNTCIHRLLSSDRVKGCGLAELRSNAALYVGQCESPETISGQEIAAMIASVLKYEPYVTTHLRYNEIYTKWLVNTSAILIGEAETTHRTLETIDQIMFYAMKRAQSDLYSPNQNTFHNAMSLANWRLMRESLYSGLGIPFQSRIKWLDEHNLLEEHGLKVRWFDCVGTVNGVRFKKTKYLKMRVSDVMVAIKALIDNWLINDVLPKPIKAAVDARSVKFLQETRFWKKHTDKVTMTVVSEEPCVVVDSETVVENSTVIEKAIECVGKNSRPKLVLGRSPASFRAQNPLHVEAVSGPLLTAALRTRMSPGYVVTTIPGAAGVSASNPAYVKKQMALYDAEPNAQRVSRKEEVDTLEELMVMSGSRPTTPSQETLAMTTAQSTPSTPAVEKIKTKIKRNVNPNLWKYVADDSMEELSTTLQWYQQLKAKFGEDAVERLATEELLLDPARTEDWLCDVRTGDVVGVGNKVYKVTEVPDVGPIYGALYPRTEQKHRTNEPPVGAVLAQITAQQVDSGLAQGRCEILYRDQKPFGFEDYEATVLVPSAPKPTTP